MTSPGELDVVELELVVAAVELLRHFLGDTMTPSSARFCSLSSSRFLRTLLSNCSMVNPCSARKRW